MSQVAFQLGQITSALSGIQQGLPLGNLQTLLTTPALSGPRTPPPALPNRPGREGSGGEFLRSRIKGPGESSPDSPSGLGSAEYNLATIQGMTALPALPVSEGSVQFRSLDDIVRDALSGRSRVLESDGEFHKVVLEDEFPLQEMADLLVLEAAFVRTFSDVYTMWFESCRSVKDGPSDELSLGRPTRGGPVMRGGSRRVEGPTTRPAPGRDPGKKLDVQDRETWDRMERINTQITEIVGGLQNDLMRVRTQIVRYQDDAVGRSETYTLLELPTRKLVALQETIYALVQMSPNKVAAPREVRVGGMGM